MDTNEIKNKITENIEKINQNEGVKLAKDELKKGSDAVIGFFANKLAAEPKPEDEVVEAEIVEKVNDAEIVNEPQSAVSFLKGGASKAGKFATDQLGKAWSVVDGGLVKRKLLKEISAFSLDELNSALKTSNDINDKELILNIIMRKKQLLAYQSLGHDEELLQAAYKSIRAERDELVEKL